MHVHKPKGAIHGWRELAREVGIIVLGVPSRPRLRPDRRGPAHWRHKVAEAGEAMRLELRDDDGPQAYVRLAIQPLPRPATRRPPDRGGGRRRPGNEIVALARRYAPPVRSWDAEAWRAAIASDVGSHVSAEQMVDWSKPYRRMADLQAVNRPGARGRGGAGPGCPARARPPGPSAETDAVLYRDRPAAAQRRTARWRRCRASPCSGHRNSAWASRRRRKQRLLAGLRTHYGDCVVTPSVAKASIRGDQLNGQRKAPGPAPN